MLALVLSAALAASLHLQLVADGLASPTYATAAPGEPNNLYVVEQPGTIRVLVGGRLRATPFLDIRSRVKSGGEQGLLSRGSGLGSRDRRRSRRLGKLLRTSVTARRPAWRVAAYGLRNPWRFSFDRANGDLYVGDVGQGDWEEVDYRTRAQLKRRWNFGWARYEGNHPFKDGPFSSAAPYVPPVAEYRHTGGSCSITGGYVYRGRAIPSFRGRYVYGDYCSGAVWSLRISGGRAVDVRREPISVPSLSSFGQDGAGELYAVSQNGRVFKLAG